MKNLILTNGHNAQAMRDSLLHTKSDNGNMVEQRHAARIPSNRTRISNNPIGTASMARIRPRTRTISRRIRRPRRHTRRVGTDFVAAFRTHQLTRPRFEAGHVCRCNALQIVFQALAARQLGLVACVHGNDGFTTHRNCPLHGRNSNLKTARNV